MTDADPWATELGQARAAVGRLGETYDPDERSRLESVRDQQAYLAAKWGAPLEAIAAALGTCTSAARRHLDVGKRLYEGAT